MAFFTPFRRIIFFLVLGALGVACLPGLVIKLNPARQKPLLNIQFSLPQASPERVEYSLTSVLENSLSQISGIKEMQSVSRYHGGSITLYFDSDTPMDQKQFEASTLIRSLYPQLPAEASYPLITRVEEEEMGQRPLLVFTVGAPFGTLEIYQQAQDVLQKALVQVEGVKEVRLQGAEPIQVHIRYDAEKLRAWHLRSEDILQALQSETLSGHIQDAQGHQYFIYQGRDSAQVNRLPQRIIAQKGGRAIYLKDVAQVLVSQAPADSYYRINGESTISLSVFAEEESNGLALGERIKHTVEQAKGYLPAGYQVYTSADETEFIKLELSKIYWRSGLSVVILLLFILLINRNLRYLLVLFAGIVLTLLLTLLALWAMRIPVHLYSLAGLTLSFGLIVDNAIVMLDHLHQRKNQKVFLALLAATLTTICALGLVLFLPEEDRLNLTEFAWVIIINLSMSLLVALAFTPAAYALWMENAEKGDKKLRFKTLRNMAKGWTLYKKGLLFSASKKPWLIAALVLLFGTPVFMLPASWEGQGWYNATVGSEWYQESARPYVDKALGGTFRLFVRHAFERSGYRDNEKTVLYVQAEMPFGSRLHDMNEVIRQVEEYLSGVEGIDQYTASVYSGEQAFISISFLPDYEKGALPYQLKSKLIARSLDWGGVQWSIYGVGRGFSNQSGEGLTSFRVKMLGYNYLRLEEQAEIMAGKLLAHKRIQEVNTNDRLRFGEKRGQEYVLSFDPAGLAHYGLSSSGAFRHLYSLSEPQFSGQQVLHSGSLLPVYLMSQQANAFSKYQLQNNMLSPADSLQVRLPQFARLDFATTSSAIYKEDRQYVRMIGFDYYGSARFGDKYLEEVLAEMKQEMPIGYTAEKVAWSWSSEKVKRQYGLLLVLMVAIFFICSILFESYRQALFIILTIPISFIGIFLVFGEFEYYFDQGGYAAFVLLGGIVVNAAIFFLHERNQVKGSDTRKTFKALRTKAVPILLTIISTCLGLLPFLLEGDSEVFWFALASGTIGGLIVSLFVIFWIIPLLLISKASK